MNKEDRGKEEGEPESLLSVWICVCRRSLTLVQAECRKVIWMSGADEHCLSNLNKHKWPSLLHHCWWKIEMIRVKLKCTQRRFCFWSVQVFGSGGFQIDLSSAVVVVWWCIHHKWIINVPVFSETVRSWSKLRFPSSSRRSTKAPDNGGRLCGSLLQSG